ncbi:flavin reductase family protein [Candidatus Bathyarchaeota archaeon]|nr:flavin reductase family protein [Candidatus Bathyarchaeota archaeon]
MAKRSIPLSPRIGALVGPKPTVLVTCRSHEGRTNIITVAAVTVASHDPPMFLVSIKENRFSHNLIKETGEFVINVPTARLIEATKLCGTVSGRDVDKFREAHLTMESCRFVSAPMIRECPINIECKVIASIKPGTHTLFVGQVVAAHVEDGLFDGEKLNLEGFPTILFNGPEYRKPGEVL